MRPSSSRVSVVRERLSGSQTMAGPGGLEPPVSRLGRGRSSSELQAQSPQAAPRIAGQQPASRRAPEGDRVPLHTCEEGSCVKDVLIPARGGRVTTTRIHLSRRADDRSRSPRTDVLRSADTRGRRDRIHIVHCAGDDACPRRIHRSHCADPMKDTRGWTPVVRGSPGLTHTMLLCCFRSSRVEDSSVTKARNAEGRLGYLPRRPSRISS